MGIPDVYFYGIDEQKGDKLVQQRKIWKAVREAGGKIIVSGFEGQFEAVGDLLDVCVWAFAPKESEAAKWHSVGHRVWNYYNPQGGVENPEIYRRNYGYVLWGMNYDGSGTYNYIDVLRESWNDFDHEYYRRHNFVYPTAEGFVPTIAWDGYREALDDVRYATALRQAMDRAKKNNPDAKLVEKAGRLLHDIAEKSATIDLELARKEIIQLILELDSRGR
jgi:hypothetical protein